jgi:2-polyprenyl-6-methoxyphenol hydroxylase-like FAD-dependent oxidoreductase
MRLLPEWLADHLDTNRQAIEAPRPLDVIVGRCPRWSAPGLLLLGDAAHPMSPVRAQGINIALRDAIVAANHLVPTLLAGQAPQSVLQAIQGERDPEIIRAQHLQYREMRGLRWARQRPWLMKPMLKLVPLILQAGFVRRFMQRSFFRQQRELRFGVKDVRLH